MKTEYRKTKIVCTIGPASEDKKTMTRLAKAGMDVMRCNFSHGDHEEHKAKIDNLRAINRELDKNIAVLLDTRGPEIRTGTFTGGSAQFKKGQVCVITTEEIEGTSERFTINYKELYEDVKPGGFILINDGQIELLVDHVEDTDIYCVCANDGTVLNHRGINVPGIELGFDYISDKDYDDIKFGCEVGVDFIAASFIRRPQDVLEIKKILVECGRPDIQIIAKIENSEAVEKIDDIIRVADGVMLARGDLGVEVDAEDVPLIQKDIIIKCKRAGKVVITATQMLESMIENPRPTRAEVSDVANAIYDGTDAVMLSGETAQGMYPEEAAHTMNKIALRIETSLDYASLFRNAMRTAPNDTSEAICMSVAEIAHRFNISAIIAYTESGVTAKKISRYRPECPVIAATPNEETIRKLALNWGLIPVKVHDLPTSDALLNLANIIAQENGIDIGEQILVTGGTPGVPGQTNFLQLLTVR